MVTSYSSSESLVPPVVSTVRSLSLVPASALARSRAGAGYGPLRIRAELATHGLGREDIEAALEACERDWAEAARELASRRFGGKDLADPSKRRKAVDFLLRRGFGARDAAAAVRAVPGEFDTD